MATKKKTPKKNKKAVKPTAAANTADKKTAEMAIAARKHRHTEQID